MKKGFTLIELMIVVAIIAILAAIAVPNFGKMKDKAAVNAAARSIEGLKYALEVYRDDPENNGLFPDLPSATPTMSPFDPILNIDMTEQKMRGSLRNLYIQGDIFGFTIVGKPKIIDRTDKYWVYLNDHMNNAEHNFGQTQNDAMAATMRGIATTLIF